MEARVSAPLVYSLLVLGLVIVGFLPGMARHQPAAVRTQEEPLSPAAPDAPVVSFYCNVNNVAAFNNRIHVRCNPANGAITYFAYATTGANASNANRFLAIADTAYALNQHV